MTLKEYSMKYGVEQVINDLGKIRHTTEKSIVFPNGWVASIIDNCGKEVFCPNGTHETVFDSNKKYSVAVCDYDGYFDWNILNKYGAIKGCFYCNTEKEVVAACEKIRNLE